MAFSDFVEKHRQDPAYLGVVGVPIPTPREIFEAETEALVVSVNMDVYVEIERDRMIDVVV